MKKLLIFLVILLVSLGSATEFMIPTEKNTVVRDNLLETRKSSNLEREAPDFEFLTDPIDLITNYYDYMPGSYNSTPIRIQPDQFGGIYMVFHGRETSDDTRRVYYAYIDSEGSLQNIGTIGTEDMHEGYPSIDIDPVTGDPFVAWHSNSDPATADLECVLTYDLYHLGSPGLWLNPFEVITDDIVTINGDLDEFIWPYVHVGPSPDPEKRRVYLQANNSYSATDPTENPLIAYADFNEDDLNNQSTLDWAYITIPMFNNWNQSIPEWIRPFHSFDVSKTDGRIAFFGYQVNETGYDSLYVCYNDNYGEGNWEYRSQEIHIDQWNPQNLDGSYAFEDDNGQARNIYWSYIFGGHMQSTFLDNKMIMSAPLGLQYDDDAGDNYYFKYLIFPYIFQYDFCEDEFHFRIQAPEINDNATNPDYNWLFDQAYCPWDTDNDGEVDEYNNNGEVMMFNGWPIYFWSDDVAFHENNFKIAINEEKGWVVNMWQNGLFSKYYNDSGDEDYIDWANIAEIYFTVSKNDGNTWSDPIIMNAKSDDAHFVQEFEDMMPAYIYLGDKIEDLGDDWGEVHLMFLDDNSFGSFEQGFGENLGGTMEYASFKIDFGSVPSSVKNPIVNIPKNTIQNYPNPFNPTTTISYSVKKPAKITIEIFNLKGQIVKTLVNEHKDAGDHAIVWNGKDEYDRNVASGVYLYKMQSGNEYNTTRKMLLMK